MVRSPSVDQSGMKKGEWSADEDRKLKAYIERYGHWNWTLLPKFAGVARSGKSCRLRWLNYLKPDVKRGSYTKEEEDIILKLHDQLGPKWSAIAKKLPGRTDNEIKNYWHTHLKKRLGKVENPILSSNKEMGECSNTGKSDGSQEHSSQISTEINKETERESSHIHLFTEADLGRGKEPQLILHNFFSNHLPDLNEPLGNEEN